jgi:uncharacterized protein YacL
MVVHITRFVFVSAGALGGFAVSRLIDWSDQIGYSPYFVIFIFIILGWSIGYVLGGIFGREFALALRRAEERLQDIAPADIVLAVVGLVTGLVLAWLVSQPIRLIEPAWVAVLATSAIFMMLGYLGLRVALIKRADFVRAVPSIAMRAEEAPARVKILDTSAVIDGRFAELRDLGLLEGEVRVPRFVLGELHTLADSADDTRRARGRRGLDLLARLSSSDDTRIEVFEADYPDIPDVDNKLLRLAAETGAMIVTADFNLTNVARVRDVAVLSLSELGSALRPSYLPGEKLHLRVVKEGKERDQGVGYLEDGTMVVVSDGSDHVGSDIDAEVTSVLQTSGGRMIFARLVETGSVVGADG